ncbi:MAG: chromate transporter [Epulopiscium sp.]|nr:chromate transporter [Candidatus Epulonipiscium sp.]
MILIKLMLDFLAIGFISYGGGIGMISYIQKVGVQKGWITLDQFSDMIALSQVTPGPIAINIATYSGYNVAGIPGAIVSTLALVIPSFILVFLVIKFFSKHMNTKWMESILDGLRVVVLALILSSLIPLFEAGFIVQGDIKWLSVLPLAYATWASLKKRNILTVLAVTGLWGIFMM